MKQADLTNLRVVVCDDHPAFAKGLANLLNEEAEEFAVVGVATKAEELKAMIQESSPDLVLIDIHMPNVNGIEATREIRKLFPSTKVMALTVSDDRGDLYQALKAGAAGYITKDREVSQIVDAMRSVVRGNLIIPADLAGMVLDDLKEADPDSLSGPEREILRAIARGETNKEIAQHLFLSERTVARRIEDIYSKLHLADRLQAAIWAVKQGLGEEEERA